MDFKKLEDKDKPTYCDVRNVGKTVIKYFPSKTILFLQNTNISFFTVFKELIRCQQPRDAWKRKEIHPQYKSLSSG